MYVIYKKHAHIYETFIHVVLEDMNPELIRRTAYVYICHIRRTLYMCIYDMHVIYIKYAHTYETLVYVIVGDANPVLVCRTSYMCTYVIHIESFIYGGSFSTGPFRFCRWVYLGVYTVLFLPAKKAKGVQHADMSSPAGTLLLLAGKGIWVSMRRRAQATTDSKCHQDVHVDLGSPAGSFSCWRETAYGYL